MIRWTQVRFFLAEIPPSRFARCQGGQVGIGVKRGPLQLICRIIYGGFLQKVKTAVVVQPQGLDVEKIWKNGSFVPARKMCTICGHWTEHDCWFKQVDLTIVIQSSWPVWGRSYFLYDICHMCRISTIPSAFARFQLCHQTVRFKHSFNRSSTCCPNKCGYNSRHFENKQRSSKIHERNNKEI